MQYHKKDFKGEEYGDEFFAGFTKKVQHDWVKAARPAKILSLQTPPDISITSNLELNTRFNKQATETLKVNWSFIIQTRGKRLRQVGLMFDDHRENFSIETVRKRKRDFGITNGQLWYDDRPEAEQSELSDISDRDERPSGVNKELYYTVTLNFKTDDYGAYRKYVIFDFGEYPVYFRTVCFDCVRKGDGTRLSNATQYNLQQMDRRWQGPSVRPFESSNVAPKHPKDLDLQDIYPHPDETNFFLTSASLSDKWLTRSNYRCRMHELIAVEELARHEQIGRYNEISRMKVCSSYSNTFIGDGSVTVKYAPPGEMYAQLPLDRPISDDTKSGRLLLRSCKTVLIQCMQSNLVLDNLIFEAQIEDKCSQTVYARLSKEFVDHLKLQGTAEFIVRLQFVLDRLAFCEWHRAIDCLSNTALLFLQDFDLSNDMDMLNVLWTKQLEEPPDHLWPNSSGNAALNCEQIKAVNAITYYGPIRLPPILLLGPFGTGKTFAIARAILRLLLEQPNCKILLCTHSNSAADLYIKEYFDRWYKSSQNERLRPLRVYYRDRERNTVHPVVHEYCLIKATGFRDPMDEDLNNCGIIVTTLATSSSIVGLSFQPSHIIIDEAAQALECEALVALALATKDTRLVFAGDHQQLAPEIYSDLASECGFGISLIERIYQLYPDQHPCKIHFKQNYRAHDDIVKFASLSFYHGIVIPAGKHQPHPFLAPLTFIAAPGIEIQSQLSAGYVNEQEASEVANWVETMKSYWPVDKWGPYREDSIGVLCYYNVQVQRIRCELRKRRLYDVTVERVLNAQGKQFTAVFVSTVRTRNCCRYSAERNIKDYGFLTNPRLLNTAVTRAKCFIGVVGDPIALLTVGRCKQLWGRYIDMADLRGIDRHMLHQLLQEVSDLPLLPTLNPLADEFVPRNNTPTSNKDYLLYQLR